MKQDFFDAFTLKLVACLDTILRDAHFSTVASAEA
jgi:hypothetical protein